MVYSDEDNKKCLAEINRVLETGGFILFDLHNLVHFLTNNRLGQHYYKDGSLLYPEDAPYDPIIEREEVNTEFYYEEELKHSSSLSLRCYTFPEFKSLLDETGFEFTSVCGNFDGSSFAVMPAASKRMIVIARKS